MRRTLLAWLAGLVLIPALAAAADYPIDLNSASLEEIMELPLPPEDARAVYEYREFRSYFESVYDLMKVPGIDARDLETLKPLVRIEPVEKDYFSQRTSCIFHSPSVLIIKTIGIYESWLSTQDKKALSSNISISGF